MVRREQTRYTRHSTPINRRKKAFDGQRWMIFKEMGDLRTPGVDKAGLFQTVLRCSDGFRRKGRVSAIEGLKDASIAEPETTCVM